MKDFEILDISGDVGIKAFGKDIEEAFIHAALGMFSLITDLDTIKDKKAIDVTVESDSLDGLLVSWLNELIFHFDTYGFIGRKIPMAEITRPSERVDSDPHLRGGGMEERAGYTLKATIYGEEFEQQRHEGKLLIKAATYHKLKIEKVRGMFEINVIFDI
jgi:SHS2 domain-containing protein